MNISKKAVCLELKGIFLILVFLLINTISSYSQSIHQLPGVQGCYGMLNAEILFCDTSKIESDYETLELIYPDFIIKNIKNNTNNVVYCNSKKVSSPFVIVKGKYLIIRPTTEEESFKLAKCDDKGLVNKDFGENGFVTLPKFEFIDLTCDSIGNSYILMKQTLENSFKYGVVLKFAHNGKPCLDFGNNGIVSSERIVGPYFNKIWLQHNMLNIACNENPGDNTEVIYTVTADGKNIEKLQRTFAGVASVVAVGKKYIYAIKRNGIEIYDQNNLVKTILKDSSFNLLTQVFFNKNNKKAYVVTGGYSKGIAKIYEIQTDLSAKLIFSSDNFNEYSIRGNDFITGITFSSNGIDLVLSVEETPEAYAYSNYLIHINF